MTMAAGLTVAPGAARASSGGVPHDSPPRRWPAVARLLVLAALIAVAVVFLARAGLFSDPRHALATLRAVRSHWWIAPVFVLTYAALTTVAFPGGALTLAGGALFGLGLGSLLNWTGAVLGACTAYGFARLVGGRAVETLLGRHASALRQLREGGGGHGFWSIFRLRLIPLVPFNALNIASGIARVPFRSYALATALGIIPGTVIYTYFADSVLAGVSGARRHALLNVLIAGGLLLALSFVPAIVKRSRR